MLEKADISSLVTPTAFALAELDEAFSDAMRIFAGADLEKRKIAHEITTYEGTAHGFAARGNLKIELVRKGWEGALVQASEWFKRYLLD